MPAPQPDTIWFEESDQGLRGTFIAYPTGSGGNRQARAKRIRRRIQSGTWKCLECGGQIGMHKRADAKYCREGCRQKALRRRAAILKQSQLET